MRVYDMITKEEKVLYDEKVKEAKEFGFDDPPTKKEFLEEKITIEKKYELLLSFNRVRKEFRNEKLLILFILNFTFLNLEISLENISFM